MTGLAGRYSRPRSPSPWRAAHVVDVLQEAFTRHGAPEIVNTDQGSQFTAEAFIPAIHDHGCKLSMDGRGSNQVYLGSPERMLEMATRSTLPNRLQVQEFGALWLANLVERDLGIADLINDIVPGEEGEEGPSVGEYFLYAIYNRMIDACSKRAMPDWYRSTAIQHIRPVEVDALNSQQFWKKWDRVDVGRVGMIANEFFRRIVALEPSTSDCFMFDTTNYFTFMASNTPSELAQRGKNKEGRNWLRQVGLPLFYREYEGNRHDSKVFLEVIDDVFQAMVSATGSQANMTVVFDKGMNSEENIAAIDARDNINFITTYSTYYSEDFIHVGLDKFAPVDNEHNKQLAKSGRKEDRLLAWRTEGEYWGHERAVIVTYNPLTATRQRYSFERKLLTLQETLFDFQAKVNRQATHRRNKASVLERYQEACANLHLPADLYNVELSEEKGKLRLNFRKNHYRIGRHIDRFGKNIIITDCMDWSTDEIVKASLDRWVVEDGFRQSKGDDHVAMMPVRHWTDSKIRCHITSILTTQRYVHSLVTDNKKAVQALPSLKESTTKVHQPIQAVRRSNSL